MAVITISNETGSGKNIYDLLVKRLNYRVIDKEMVRYAASMGGISQNQANALDEANFNSIKSTIAQYIDLSLFSPADMFEMNPSELKRKYDYRPYEYSDSPSGANFQYAIEKVIYMLANGDNVIIRGRGGNFILKDRLETLHLRIVSPLEVRIANVAKSMDFSLETAKKHIQMVDKSKAKYIKSYFKADIDDADNYDIVVNEAALDPVQITEGLIAMIDCWK